MEGIRQKSRQLIMGSWDRVALSRAPPRGPAGRTVLVRLSQGQTAQPCFQLSGGDYQLSIGVYQLSGSYFQLKRASPQLTVLQTFNSLPTQIPTQSVFSNSKLHSWRGKFFTNGGANFSLMVGLHGKPSPATSGRCPWTAPPPSSRSHTSASVRENRSHLQEKLQFYGPLKVQHPLYRGRHSHLGLKS